MSHRKKTIAQQKIITYYTQSEIDAGDANNLPTGVTIVASDTGTTYESDGSTTTQVSGGGGATSFIKKTLTTITPGVADLGDETHYEGGLGATITLDADNFDNGARALGTGRTYLFNYSSAALTVKLEDGTLTWSGGISEDGDATNDVGTPFTTAKTLITIPNSKKALIVWDSDGWVRASLMGVEVTQSELDAGLTLKANKAGETFTGDITVQKASKSTVKIQNTNYAGSQKNELNFKHGTTQVAEAKIVSNLPGANDVDLEFYTTNNNVINTTPALKITGNNTIESNGVKVFRNQSGDEATTSARGLLSSTDKSKLNGIASGAEANVQSDWSQSTNTADDFIKNKPVNATTSTAGFMSSTDKTKLDGIATGAEVNVQSDWNESGSTADAFIKNKPTIPTVNDTITDGNTTSAPSENAVFDALVLKEATANKASTFSTTPANVKFPTEKLVKDNLDLKLDKTGGTLTGALTLSADPTANLHASTKQYVDAKVASSTTYQTYSDADAASTATLDTTTSDAIDTPVLTASTDKLTATGSAFNSNIGETHASTKWEAAGVMGATDAVNLLSLTPPATSFTAIATDTAFKAAYVDSNSNQSKRSGAVNLQLPNLSMASAWTNTAYPTVSVTGTLDHSTVAFILANFRGTSVTSVVMGGGFVGAGGNGTATSAVISNSINVSVANEVTFWVAHFESPNTKAIKVKLTVSSGNIVINVLEAAHWTTNVLTSDAWTPLGGEPASKNAGTVAGSQTASGYGLHSITINFLHSQIALVPTLASNTSTVSGEQYILFGSTPFSTSYPWWQAFDGNNGTDFATQGDIQPWHIGVQFASAKTVIGAFVRSRGSAEGPTKWKVQGSDDGTTYTDVHSVTSTNLGAANASSFIQFNNSTTYTYYRLYAETSAGTNHGVSTLQFYA